MLTNIRRCTADIQNLNKNHEVLHKCTNDKNLRLIEEIGSGAFGTVYLANYHNKKICIKRIETEYDTNQELNEAIDDIIYEVEYCYNMAVQKIGPKIYDAFYIVNEKDKKILCYILMEVFDSDVYGAYESKKFTVAELVEINKQMINLLKRQIFINSIYCVDIKTGNYVVKKENGKIIVRMIDFSNTYCTLGKYPEEYKSVEYLYLTILLQLYLFICLFIVDYNIDKVVLEPFYNDKIFKKYVINKKLKGYYIILKNILNGENENLHKQYFKDSTNTSLPRKIIDFVLDTVNKTHVSRTSVRKTSMRQTSARKTSARKTSL